MIDIKGKYQASVFGNFADILPSPEIISTVLTLFRDKNLLPSTFQEISQVGSGPLARLKLSSPNNEWNLNFGTRRIDVEQNSTDPKGQNLGTVEEFTEQAHEYFTLVLPEFRRRANRISLITGEFLKEMSEEKLITIYNKLFIPIAFYGQNPPFEWNSRSVARMEIEIGGSTEKINVITNINRVRGQLMQPQAVLEFDRIEIGFDINTIQENQETRFDTESVKTFYVEANKIRNDILLYLEAFLDV